MISGTERRTEMTQTTSSKGWICAVVAVAFITLGISGLLMLLHVTLPFSMKHLHIVMGIVFVVAGVTHLVLNRGTFTAHFRSRSTIIAAVATVAIAAALLFIAPGEGGGPHRYGQGREELGIGTGGDFGGGPGPFGNGPRGNGPGYGRWGYHGNEGSGSVE
jgi:amino acid transporter